MAGVQLPVNRFEVVTGALTEKYGQPTKKEESTMKTRAGVEYPQVELTWIDGEEILKAKRLAGGINTMSVTVTSKKYVEAAEARRGAAKKKGAKDL